MVDRDEYPSSLSCPEEQKTALHLGGSGGCQKCNLAVHVFLISNLPLHLSANLSNPSVTESDYAQAGFGLAVENRHQ